MKGSRLQNLSKIWNQARGGEEQPQLSNDSQGSPDDTEGFLSGLQVQFEYLTRISKHSVKTDREYDYWRKFSPYTTICFAKASKVLNFMALKQGLGISVHKDGREVLFKRSSDIIDTASARNQYYYYEKKVGVQKVDMQTGRPSVSHFHKVSLTPSENLARSIRPFMNKTALLVAQCPTSAVAIMLDLKGDKNHILNLKPKNFRDLADHIVDMATCDDKLTSISTLFVLT